MPTYNPTVVYGAWPYPAYPPYYYYPPCYAYPPGCGLRAASFWGVRHAVGAALWGGCNWGGGDVNININNYNNFNRTNIRTTTGKHNAEHRKGVALPRPGERRQDSAAATAQAAQSREQFRGRDDSLGGGGLKDREGPAAGGPRSGGARRRA